MRVRAVIEPLDSVSSYGRRAIMERVNASTMSNLPDPEQDRHRGRPYKDDPPASEEEQAPVDTTARLAQLKSEFARGLDKREKS